MKGNHVRGGDWVLHTGKSYKVKLVGDIIPNVFPIFIHKSFAFFCKTEDVLSRNGAGRITGVQTGMQVVRTSINPTADSEISLSVG